MMQEKDRKYEGYYNVGPEESDCVTTGELVDLFCEKWQDGMKWKNVSEANAPHEANFLKLDCSKLKSTFGWKPFFHVSEAVELTVEFSKLYMKKEDIADCMKKQIQTILDKKAEKSYNLSIK